jgi:hypothetical protein
LIVSPSESIGRDDITSADHDCLGIERAQAAQSLKHKRPRQSVPPVIGPA